MSPEQVTLGAVVSWTVIVNVFWALLPLASCAVTTTSVVPSAKVEPEAAELLAATVPFTKSKAERENSTTAPAGPVASTTIFSGAVIVGAMVSTTVTVNDPCDLFPRESVAVTFTTVVPRANPDPEGAVTAGTTGPSTRSFALTSKKTCAPSGPVASITLFSGKCRTGAV